MFSGGAIYVVIVVVIFFALFFSTIIYLLKSLLKWKKVWHLVSDSIEIHSHDENISKIKTHLSAALEQTGLKQLIDNNLQKRGFRRNL